MADVVENGVHDTEDAVLLSDHAVRPSPDVLTKLIKRLRALTLRLLPIEVSPEIITAPTSRVITGHVIDAYRDAAGDFVHALPYCLLRARVQFMWDANHNPADYSENVGRATACEVLARRIVHLSRPDEIMEIMSTRYRHRQLNGDESELASALEVAIDSDCSIFLSSSEAQEVVSALWSGSLVQRNNPNHDIDYVRYYAVRDRGFWARLDPSRLSVPRYQNIFRIVVWLFFLIVYSQAVRQPLERLRGSEKAFDGWEIILYVMSLSFVIEDMHKFYSLLRFVTWRAFSFWNVVAFITDSLLLSTFILRVLSTREQGNAFRVRSFQVLSFVSPFIWMKLLTIFDGFKYIGTLQICVARMLKESGIFFALSSVLAIGFAQGLYALDAADGTIEDPSTVINVLVQALLQSPDYSKYSGSPFGLLLYYFWNAATALILLNVLISLFSTAYSEVVDNAEAQYLAFFAGKTIGMIRAPDSYVYPAPFNILETVFIAPFEFFPALRLSPATYAKLNRYVMIVVFFIPLMLIAMFETSFETDKHTWFKKWLKSDDEGGADYRVVRDPDVGDEEGRGMKISKVPFDELVKRFPDMEQSSEATILAGIQELKLKLDAIKNKLDARSSV